MVNHWSGERQQNGENRPRPFGFRPSTQRSRAGDLGLRRKSGHTSLSPLCLEQPNPAGSASHPTDEDLSVGTTDLGHPNSGSFTARGPRPPAN